MNHIHTHAKLLINWIDELSWQITNLTIFKFENLQISIILLMYCCNVVDLTIFYNFYSEVEMLVQKVRTEIDIDIIDCVFIKV